MILHPFYKNIPQLGLPAAECLLGELRFLAHSGPSSQVIDYLLGAAGSYPPGSRNLVPEANALIVHGQEGLRAIILTCTHLGCHVKQTVKGFACPCHNSQFDQHGHGVHRPAAKSLESFELKTGDKGKLVLRKPG